MKKEENYCERCGISESDYGFEFVSNCQGELMCEDCAEESDEEWKEFEK